MRALSSCFLANAGDRASATPASLIAPVRREVQSLEPDLPLPELAQRTRDRRKHGLKLVASNARMPVGGTLVGISPEGGCFRSPTLVKVPASFSIDSWELPGEGARCTPSLRWCGSHRTT
jgi:hypothetical protein